MHRASPRVAASRPATSLIATLLLAAGCGGSPDPGKEIDTVSSWTATMQLALADREHRHTTKLHATELRDRAREAMEGSRQALDRQPLSPDDRHRAAASLDSLHAAIGELDRELNLP